MSPSANIAESTPHIIDIRNGKNGMDLVEWIVASLKKPSPSIPTVVLYDDRGLELFDRITYLPEYYLTNAEIDVLERHADDMAKQIASGSILVELGSGSLRKTRLLLDAVDRNCRNITYYALDLSADSLLASLAPLHGKYTNIKVAGLHGTYDDGRTFLASMPPETPKVVLWLGSSIGNLDRDEASRFLREFQTSCLHPGDFLVCGIDRRQSKEVIELAYNDPAGITQEFILNGLDHCNRLLNSPIFDRSKFAYVARYDVDKGRHEAYYKSLVNQHLSMPVDRRLHAGQLVHVEFSYKYSLEEVDKLSLEIEMKHIARWSDSSNRYDVHLFKK